MSMKKVFELLAVFTFIIWWGGFTFYASFVLPAAQEITGDHVMAGFITQLVAVKINIASLLAWIFLVINEWAGRNKAKKMNQFLLAYLVIMLVGIIALFMLYPHLGSLLDNITHEETDHKRFYMLHRIYLLISSLLWLNGALLIIHYALRRKSD